MANLESLRQAWGYEKVDVIANTQSLLLLERDFSTDLERIENLDTTTTMETVNHVAGALDNRMVVLATLWGALAGGLAGGAAGIIGGG